jgi:hypothetical protein
MKTSRTVTGDLGRSHEIDPEAVDLTRSAEYRQIFPPPELIPDGSGRFRRNPAALARQEEREALFREAFLVGYRFEANDHPTCEGFVQGRRAFHLEDVR